MNKPKIKINAFAWSDHNSETGEPETRHSVELRVGGQGFRANVFTASEWSAASIEIPPATAQEIINKLTEQLANLPQPQEPK